MDPLLLAFNVSFSSHHNVPRSVLWPCSSMMSAALATRLQSYYKLIGVLSMMSSFLSIVGSTSILLFIARRGLCMLPEIRPLFHLSVADLLLALMWFTTPIVYFSNSNTSSPHAITCFILQTITETVHVVTFFLTINYAANVYICMRERTARLDDLEMPLLPGNAARAKWVQPACCAVSWVLPLLLFLPFLIRMDSANINACHRCIMLIDVPRPQGISSIWQNYGYIIMIVTLSVAIAANLVLYTLTLLLYRRSIPALIIASMDVQYSTYKSIEFEPLDRYVALFALQALTAPLQGFLNCVVYGWGRKTFRHIVLSSARQHGDAAVPPEEIWTSESDRQAMVSP